MVEIESAAACRSGPTPRGGGDGNLASCLTAHHCGGGAVALPLWQKRESAVEHDQTTERARARRRRTDALRQQLTTTGDYNSRSEKYAYPSTVQPLDDVTRLLPDDTWLTQLEIKNTERHEPSWRDMLGGESGRGD